MADDLVERLKEAGNRTMTAAEKFEQRVSFVYGQQDHDKPMRSKDEIRRAVADMMGYPLDAIESLRAENARLTEERDALEEGLRWYAEPHIYAPHPNGPAFDDRDLSWHARSVLAKVKIMR